MAHTDGKSATDIERFPDLKLSTAPAQPLILTISTQANHSDGPRIDRQTPHTNQIERGKERKITGSLDHPGLVGFGGITMATTVSKTLHHCDRLFAAHAQQLRSIEGFDDEKQKGRRRRAMGYLGRKGDAGPCGSLPPFLPPPSRIIGFSSIFLTTVHPI